jgi:hypothetical protein
MVLRITLDTNCIINIWAREEPSATSVQELDFIFKQATLGKADVAITTRVASDLSNDKNEARKTERLNMLNMFQIIPTALRWDTSTWDGGDHWASEETIKAAEEIQKIVFPNFSPDEKRAQNKINDIDHLVGHWLAKRDVFVTDDKEIIWRRDELAQLNIRPMTPTECCTILQALSAERVIRDLTAGSVGKYASATLRGDVVFDYSNNNGKFAIGNAKYLFETQWHKASDTSIHAVSDCASIKALALANGVEEFSGIGDPTRFDFSSRVRTPSLGQIVIWQNINGYFAATKIVRIKDNKRQDDRDELSFVYTISENPNAEFS